MTLGAPRAHGLRAAESGTGLGGRWIASARGAGKQRPSGVEASALWDNGPLPAVSGETLLRKLLTVFGGCP